MDKSAYCTIAADFLSMADIASLERFVFDEIPMHLPAQQDPTCFEMLVGGGHFR